MEVNSSHLLKHLKAQGMAKRVVIGQLLYVQGHWRASFLLNRQSEWFCRLPGKKRYPQIRSYFVLYHFVFLSSVVLTTKHLLVGVSFCSQDDRRPTQVRIILGWERLYFFTHQQLMPEK